VGYYATLVNINAYHQPGVEAGKKAAGDFLKILTGVRAQLAKAGSATADEVASALGADAEEVYHCLVHLAANETHILQALGKNPGEDRFTMETHT
jgi:glucose-6-phosphate isomerase